MAKALVLLLSIAAVLIEIASAVDYCELQCKNENETQAFNHTLCQYTANVKCESSGFTVTEVGLKQEEKDAIVDLHNNLRLKFEFGNEIRGNPGPQPAAIFMAKLEWDDELAMMAQHWANQCSFGYDQCRRTEKYLVGQNVGKIKVSVYEKHNGILIKPKKPKPLSNATLLEVERIVLSWYDNVVLWDKNDTYKPFKNIEEYKEGKKVQLFTQMIWSKTTKIGCGAVRYAREPYVRKLYLVCNYAPTGNVAGKRLYIPIDDELKEWQQNWEYSLPGDATNVTIRAEERGDEPIIVHVGYSINDEPFAMTKDLPIGAKIVSMRAEKNDDGNLVATVMYYDPSIE